MKKLSCLLVLLVIFLVACSNESAEGEKSTDQKQEEKEGAVNVDKGLLNVELTLPASFLKEKI